MSHPNQASIDAMTAALLLDHMGPHLDAPAAFARQTAQYIDRSDADAPDPDEVEAGTRLFLALRMAWNVNPHEVAAPAETMSAMQDALLALGYDLDLDGHGFDMHTPKAEGALAALGATAVEHLAASGFEEDADVGVLDAALWHAIAHHVVADALEESDPGRMVSIHARLRYALITRLYTGSYSRDRQGMTGLVDEARGVVLDMTAIPDGAEMITVSLLIRSTFGVEDEATGMDGQMIEGAPLLEDVRITIEAMGHASATLAAVAGSTKEIAWATLTTMLMGSRTGIPASPNLEAVYLMVREAGDLLDGDEDEVRESLLDAVATICCAMMLTGRLEVLDEQRNGILINMASEYIRQHLDPAEDNVAVIIESMVDALEIMHPEVDDFLGYAAATESDGDAAMVRIAMDRADPSPPPAGDVTVVPTAILIEMSEDEQVDVTALRHRIEAFFHVQPDSFRAFAQGDVYWRLVLDGHNGYSGTVGALKTISELEGVARASVVHRSAAGLGVTSMQKGTRSVHRLISQA